YQLSASHSYREEHVYSVNVLVTNQTATGTGSTVATIHEEPLPAGTLDTANQRFVSELYHDLLNRGVDTEGFAFWTGLLDRGLGRDQMVASFEASREYQSLVVLNTYQRFAGRIPNAAE